MLNRSTHLILIPPNAYYDTAHNPLRVLCKDGFYVIKANHSNSLFDDFGFANEFICSCLLNLWGLNTPEIAVVRADPDLISKANLPKDYIPKLYSKPCFGSKFIESPNEFLPEFFNNTQIKFRNKISNYRELIFIGLFDLWVKNEDRAPVHPNLITGYSQKNQKIFAIDHYKTLNFNHPTNDFAVNNLLLESNSILNTPLLRSIFNEAKNDIPLIETTFLRNIESCKASFSKMMDGIEDLTHFNCTHRSILAENLFNFKRNKTIFAHFLKIVR